MQIAQEYVARDSLGCRTEPYALESSGAFGACRIPASAASVVGEEGGLRSSMSNGRFGGDRGRVAELMCESMRLEMEGERRDELGRGKRPIVGCGMH
jgi:hypothetical protein